MGLVKKAYDYIKDPSRKDAKSKKKLLKFLLELKTLESKLWGITLKHVSHSEETILEETNHLIYILGSKKDQELKSFLETKEIEEFMMELKKLHQDFLYLKRKIKEKNKLRDLVSSYTILLVDQKNYTKLEKIFLLEKQLYEVIDKQEQEFTLLLKEGLHLNLNLENKTEIFIESLKEVRDILAGHMDHHNLWDEERHGYSNTSNIIHSIIKLVKENT